MLVPLSTNDAISPNSGLLFNIIANINSDFSSNHFSAIAFYHYFSEFLITPSACLVRYQSALSRYLSWPGGGWYQRPSMYSRQHSSYAMEREQVCWLLYWWVSKCSIYNYHNVNNLKVLQCSKSKYQKVVSASIKSSSCNYRFKKRRPSSCK